MTSNIILILKGFYCATLTCDVM